MNVLLDGSFLFLQAQRGSSTASAVLRNIVTGSLTTRMFDALDVDSTIMSVYHDMVRQSSPVMAFLRLVECALVGTEPQVPFSPEVRSMLHSYFFKQLEIEAPRASNFFESLPIIHYPSFHLLPPPDEQPLHPSFHQPAYSYYMVPSMPTSTSHPQATTTAAGGGYNNSSENGSQPHEHPQLHPHMMPHPYYPNPYIVGAPAERAHEVFNMFSPHLHQQPPRTDIHHM